MNLKTLHTRSTQEIFTFVKTHLLEQNVPAFDGGECMLKLPLADGRTLSCAVGCLIADDEYNEDMEADSDAFGFIAKYTDVTDDETQAMLYEMQQIHDGHDPEEWAARLNYLESQYPWSSLPPAENFTFTK